MAWDITAATLSSSTGNLYGDSTQLDMAFAGDGLAAYTVGASSSTVGKAVLATAFAAPDGTAASSVFDYSAQLVTAGNIDFSADGLVMFLGSQGASASVFQYTLATAFDPSTATYASKSYAFGATIGNLVDIEFSPDGLIMLVLDGSTGKKVHEYRMAVAWDLSTVYLPTNSSYVGTQDGIPTGVIFSADGFTMYVAGFGTNTIYQYGLTAAFDVGTATYASKSLYIGGQTSYPHDAQISSDGTKVYVSGEYDVHTIFQYNLSVAWDLSTGSYASKSLSVLAQDSLPTGLKFSADGTNAYITGNTNNSVFQYGLSTAWDISTATYSSKSVYVGSQEGTPNGVVFSSDGLKMYVCGNGSNTVYQYSLSVAWDVSTAAYASKSFYIGLQESATHGIEMSSDGGRLYVVGLNSDTVYQYGLGTAWDISTAAAYTTSPVLSVAVETTTPVAFEMSAAGTTMFVLDSSTEDISQYDIATGWDIMSGSFAHGPLDVSPESTAGGVFLSPDGLTAYTAGGSTATIYQYSLSVAWDISTAAYASKSLYVGAQDAILVDLFLSPDGTKAYAVGYVTGTIYQYSLSTAWDISTGSYASKSLSVSAQTAQPTDVSFSTDGMKAYVTSTQSTARAVFQYSLSTAFDVSTGSYASKALGIQPAGQGFSFSPDGTKGFVVESQNDRVTRYDFSTAWDVSTGVFVSNLDVGAFDTDPSGVWVNPDGSTLYVAGWATATIYQFNMGTAWDLTTATYAAILDATSVSSGMYGFEVFQSGDLMYVYTGSSGTPLATARYSLVAMTVPSAPVGLAATPGVGFVVLGWAAPISDGGSTVTWYLVEYKTTAGSVWSTFETVAAPAVSSTVTGLTNDTSYDFRVSAINSVGAGPTVEVTTTPGGHVSLPKTSHALIEIAFGVDPFDSASLDAPASWTDVTASVREATYRTSTRSDRFATFSAGNATVTLDDLNREFDPSYSGSTHAGDFRRSTPVRIVGRDLVGNASFDVATSTWTLNGHGLVVDDRIEFVAVGTGAEDHAQWVDYFVISATANTFQISVTLGGGLFAGTGTDSVGVWTVAKFFTQFYGYVKTWTPGYSGHDAVTTITATDSLGVVARYALELVASAYGGDTVAERIGRVLDEVGFPSGLRDLDTGTTLAATTFDVNALTHCQVAAASDGGFLYAQPDGTLTFDGILALAGDRQQTSQATFSHDTSPTYLVNGLKRKGVGEGFRNLVRVGGGAVTTATIDKTGTNEAPVVYQRTDLLMDTDAQAVSLANFFSDLYSAEVPSTTEVRFVAAGVVTPYHNSVLFGLRLRDRVTVEFAPPGGGSVLSDDCFIDGISGRITPARWDVTYHLSSADVYDATLGASPGDWMILDSVTDGILDTNRLGY